ncbi:MAG TPA: hypothetical protein VMP00_08355 [Burkholderiales bacterium]|nr:hypothetical protein [Burkholderiales bacterium]
MGLLGEAAFATLGVVMLLFVIGLELQPPRPRWTARFACAHRPQA